MRGKGQPGQEITVRRSQKAAMPPAPDAGPMPGATPAKAADWREDLRRGLVLRLLGERSGRAGAPGGDGREPVAARPA